ncbi:MAG: response regulator [Eubacterium sp.]|nr:response regulator [Eubacterium sp.]
MKKIQTSKILQTILFLLAVATAVGTVVHTTLFHTSDRGFEYGSSGFQALTDNWSYRLVYSDGTYSGKISTSLPTDIPAENIEELRMYTYLPSNLDSGIWLNVNSAFQSLEIYVDNELIYSLDKIEGLTSNPVVYGRRRFIKLEGDCSGKQLEIHYKSLLSSFKGRASTVYIGDKTSIIYYLLWKYILINLAGGLATLMGIILLVVYLIKRRDKWIYRIYPTMGFTLYLIGVWVLTQTATIHAFFADTAGIHTAEMLSLLLLPLPALRLIDESQNGRFRKIINAISAVDILIITFEIVMAFAFKQELMNYLLLTNGMLIVTVAYCFVTTIIIYFTDRAHFHKLRWLHLAYLCIGAATVGEIVMLLFVPTLEYGQPVSLGIMGFSFCAMVWMFQQTSYDEAQVSTHLRQAEVKTAFLANTSHEIRTPINAILGMSTLIVRESDDPQIRETAQEMREGGLSLLNLINSILDLSRIDSDKMRIINEPYDMSGFIDSIDGMQHEFPGIGLETSINSVIPIEATGDKEKILRIIRGILQYASQHTATRTMMNISFEEHNETTIVLVIDIRDCDHSLTREELRGIKRPFSLSPLLIGRVIGLSVSASLTELMNGKITAMNSGQDACFTIRLPQTGSLADTLTRYTVPSREAEEPSFNNVRILAVDDTPMNLRIFQRLLMGTGAQITTASTGEEALELAAANTYDLIFLDNIMPGISGEETFQAIRSDATGPNSHCPIVMMTADNSPENNEKYFAMGFASFLYKPYGKADLIKIMNKILNDGEVRDDK